MPLAVNYTLLNLTCNNLDLLSVDDKCAFAQQICGDDVKLAVLYYCNEFINGNILIMLPIILLASFISFLLLSSTAENYLTPALELLAFKFGFSETVAGVTLLAFANGAPDVLSSFSASSGNSAGIYLSLGAIFGAGLFVTTFVFAKVIQTNASLGNTEKTCMKLKFEETGRDMGFFIVAIIILTIYAIDGHISFFESSLFLVIYATFIVLVCIVDWKQRKEKKQETQHKKIQEEAERLNEYKTQMSGSDKNRIGRWDDDFRISGEYEFTG